MEGDVATPFCPDRIQPRKILGISLSTYGVDRGIMFEEQYNIRNRTLLTKRYQFLLKRKTVLIFDATEINR